MSPGEGIAAKKNNVLRSPHTVYCERGLRAGHCKARKSGDSRSSSTTAKRMSTGCASLTAEPFTKGVRVQATSGESVVHFQTETPFTRHCRLHLQSGLKASPTNQNPNKRRWVCRQRRLADDV